jgi:hypothetical protein
VNGTVRLEELFADYHEQVEFINIYIREAHPIDGWWMGRRLTRHLANWFFPKASMDHYDPKTIEERRVVAGTCKAALDFDIRTYVDEMDDRMNEAYAAWPTRLYLIGLYGKVVYASGLGPWAFKPEALKRAIDQYLEENRIHFAL